MKTIYIVFAVVVLGIFSLGMFKMQSQEISTDDVYVPFLNDYEFELQKDNNACYYHFMVSGLVDLEKKLDFDTRTAIPCGCLYDLEIPHSITRKKVTIAKKDYKGQQSIMEAVEKDSIVGFTITRWHDINVWYIKSTLCPEEDEDLPIPKKVN